MNIFGIGPAELVLVFLLMLMVAGPKRMIAWSHVAGQYVAKFRKMWSETSALLRKEFEQAGVEPEVMDTLEQWANPRTRPRVNPLNSVVNEIKKPVEDTLKPVSKLVSETGTTPLKPAATPNPSRHEGASNPATPKPESPAPQNGSASENDNAAPKPEQTDGKSPGTYDAWTPN